MDKKSLEDIIQREKGVILYFYGENCSVCKALKPKVKEEFTKNFPDLTQIFIDAESEKSLLWEFGISTVPTIIIFLKGKEFFKESRNFSLTLLVEKTSRVYEILG